MKFFTGSYQYAAEGIVNKFVIDLGIHEVFLVLRSWIAKVENLEVFTHLKRVSLASTTSSAICKFKTVRPMRQNLALPSILMGSAASVRYSITRAAASAASFVDCE